MPQRDQRWWSGSKSARSARTRRIVWSARRWPQRGTSGVKSSLDQKWSLVKYRDVSVKHATSPSHRDRSRQVVILRFAIQPALGRKPRPATAYCSTPFNLPARSGCFSNSCRLSDASFSPRRETNASPSEISTQFYRCPYYYRLPSDNRLESVANAHTAADLHVRPVSKTALVSRSWALRAC
jgi:hypothetical protein